MRQFFYLILFTLSPAIMAETIESKVYEVDGRIIKFENGRVAFIDKNNTQIDIEKNDLIKASIDENSSLISFKKIAATPSLKNKMIYRLELTPPLFEPTIIPNIQEAAAIFNRSNPFYKRISECTDRAHVWANDEFKHSGIKSMKAFIFFTASYINSVRFKWWFHVAPMYRVNHSGEIIDLVMDFRYTDRPMTVKEWSDQFVYTKRSCKVTTKFSEYDVNPQTENCYLICESMHYKIPGEIHEQELSGRYKSETFDSEIKASMRFGFQL